MKYSWILFDLDNTIYDFDASSAFALRKTFEAFDVDYNQANIDLYHKINHQCWTDFENGKMDFKTIRGKRFELFGEAINQSLDSEAMGDRYLYLLSTTDFKIDGAIDLLEELKPIYNLAVVTNGLKEVKRPQLSKPEIAHYFKAIIISEEVGIAKPHAGFFEHTFSEIGHPDKSKVIIVGDSLNSDIRGGNDYGIDTCWFNPKQKENDTAIKPRYEIQKLNGLFEFLK